MGTTYETILVAAPLDAVEAAIWAAGRDATVRQIAGERILVDTEDRPRGLAMDITERTGRPAFTTFVFDSDVVECRMYAGGARVHRYVSDIGMLVETFEDEDGVFRSVLDGRVLADGESPSGPIGADPLWFMPFAIGEVDPEDVRAALLARKEYTFAEEHHDAILNSLGLPSYN
ncbi:hypothetical protein ABZS66_61000 [Dactylosporangium sp. NPDC005572]|uniref:hypothetical protein n=1 Tax=Dactylosporangium sp. NPDC005572 TaxID=3156889 RepID=UPI0033A23BDA